MAAGPCPHRISMEYVRLRPDRTAGAGADGLADWSLGIDVSERRDLRQSGRVDGREIGRAQTMDRTGSRRVAAGCNGHFRWRSPQPAADRDADRGQAADHAAEPSAARQIQLLRESGGYEEISDAVRSRFRAAIDRGARHQHFDLA